MADHDGHHDGRQYDFGRDHSGTTYLTLLTSIDAIVNNNPWGVAVGVTQWALTSGVEALTDNHAPNIMGYALKAFQALGALAIFYNGLRTVPFIGNLIRAYGEVPLIGLEGSQALDSTLPTMGQKPLIDFVVVVLPTALALKTTYRQVMGD